MRYLLPLLLAAACALPDRGGGRPSWVMRGSGVFQDEAGAPAFYGRGVAAEVRTPELGWNISKERARAEITELVTVAMAEHTRRYLESNYGKRDAARDHSDVDAMKGFIQFTVKNAQLAGTYAPPHSGRYYALYKLDTAEIKRQLDKTTALDPNLRGYLKANVDRSGELGFRLHREASEKDAPRALPPPPPAAPVPDAKNEVLRRLDLGLSLHYARRYEESDRELAAAEERIKHILAGPAPVEGDPDADYAGDPGERRMLAFFRGLNAAFLNRADETALSPGEGEAVLVHYNGLAPRKSAKTWTVTWEEGLAELNKARKDGAAFALEPKLERALATGLKPDGVTAAVAELSASTFTIVSSELRAGTQAAAAALAAALEPPPAADRRRLVARAAAKAILRKSHDEDVALKYGRNSWQHLLIQETTNATKASAGADTRASAELPAQVLMARLKLAPGSYDLTATFRDAAGAVVARETFKGVEILGGRRAYLGARTTR